MKVLRMSGKWRRIFNRISLLRCLHLFMNECRLQGRKPYQELSPLCNNGLHLSRSTEINYILSIIFSCTMLYFDRMCTTIHYFLTFKLLYV